MTHTRRPGSTASGRDGCDPEFLRRAGGRASPARPDHQESAVRSRGRANSRRRPDPRGHTANGRRDARQATVASRRAAPASLARPSHAWQRSARPGDRSRAAHLRRHRVRSGMSCQEQDGISGHALVLPKLAAASRDQCQGACDGAPNRAQRCRCLSIPGGHACQIGPDLADQPRTNDQEA